MSMRGHIGYWWRMRKKTIGVVKVEGTMEDMMAGRTRRKEIISYDWIE
jgi:hypothetical protein